MSKKLWLVLIAGLALPANAGASEATLRGSKAAMQRQNQIAKENDYTFLRTPAQVRKFVAQGHLMPLYGNRSYAVANASFPYARPEVALFVERLSAQHLDACGQKLVVTSATRPTSSQPRNASPLSVHPAGMAVDLRISDRASCRVWLENTLLSLEAQNLLDVTRERNPPHYHVAIFPHLYAAHVEAILADSIAAAEEAEKERLAALAAWRAAQPKTKTQKAQVAALPMPSAPRGISPPFAVLLSVLAFAAGAPLLVRGLGRLTEVQLQTEAEESSDGR